MRSFLFRTTNLPNPEILTSSPEERVRLTISRTDSRISSASFFCKLRHERIASDKSAFVMAELLPHNLVSNQGLPEY